jgi:predicted dinucleotide-binding enzyme
VKIGIIGAGNIGSALTRGFTALGHEVSVANSRGPETLGDLAAATGASAVTVGDAANGGDVVIVTIPEKSVPDLPAGFLDGAAQAAVVIDTGNYYPQRDGRIEAIENGMTESRWVSQQIGHPVVKAFNNIQAQHLAELRRPPRTPGRIALPVAGDDEASKAVVMGLVDELGFDPIDAGSLDESWRQQPGSPVYARDYDAGGVRRALAEATPGRGPDFRHA